MAPIGGGSRRSLSIVLSAYGIGRLSLSTIPDGSITIQILGAAVALMEPDVEILTVLVIEDDSELDKLTDAGTPMVPAKL
jgi:hypothetical protein